MKEHKTQTKLRALAADVIYISETDSAPVVFSTRRQIEILEWDNQMRKLAEQNEQWKSIREIMETDLDHLQIVKFTTGAKTVIEMTGRNSDGKIVGVRLAGVET